MRRIIIAVALGALAAPVAAAAENQPNPRSQAEKNCREQQAKIGSTAFRDLYGTNRNKSNAFGKCVSRQTEVVAAIQQQAPKNAAKACAAERQALGEEAFAKKYGTNRNGRNAFGKCVSSRARQHADQANAQQQQATINAARKCKAERRQLGEQAFANKYGTNRNKSNAFGKCVSRQARS